MASVMTEVVSGDLDNCALCGTPEAGHGKRQGFAHLGDDRPKTFVPPSVGLRARRVLARRSGAYEIAETNPITGVPSTHFVRTRCACGAGVLAIPERAATARCETCTREAHE
jgi:hypothetical protein